MSINYATQSTSSNVNEIDSTDAQYLAAELVLVPITMPGLVAEP